MPRKPKSLANQLRKAIADAEKKGVTRYQIAKASGVSQGTLSTFVNFPDRELRTNVADRVAKALGFRIELTKPD